MGAMDKIWRRFFYFKITIIFYRHQLHPAFLFFARHCPDYFFLKLCILPLYFKFIYLASPIKIKWSFPKTAINYTYCLLGQTQFQSYHFQDDHNFCLANEVRRRDYSVAFPTAATSTNLT